MKKKDGILIGCILAAALCIWLANSFFSPSGKGRMQLLVTVDGETYGTYSLDQDRDIEIGSTNVCQIRDGKVRMISAACPDHLCMEQKEIHAPGRTIVCLPNRVVLEIKKAGPAGQPEEEIDAIT